MVNGLRKSCTQFSLFLSFIVVVIFAGAKVIIFLLYTEVVVFLEKSNNK